jgi:hypothetical protein
VPRALLAWVETVETEGPVTTILSVKALTVAPVVMLEMVVTAGSEALAVRA